MDTGGVAKLKGFTGSGVEELAGRAVASQKGLASQDGKGTQAASIAKGDASAKALRESSGDGKCVASVIGKGARDGGGGTLIGAPSAG